VGQVTTNKERVRQFRAAFEALPLSAFNDPADSDNLSVESVIAQVFGPNTTTKPVIHVAEVGGWVKAHTVVVEPVDGSGVLAFVVNTQEENGYDGVGHTRGARINTLTRALNGKVWAAADRIELAVKMMRKVGQIEDDGYRINFDTSGALNEEPKVWMLSHVLSLLSDAERADHAMFLAALACPSAVFERMERLLGAVDNVRANWPIHDEAEVVSSAAVERYNGVKVSGAQLERLGVPGALLPFPRNEWDKVADGLVASVYARLGDTLDARFYPKPVPPPQPPRPKRSTATSWGFPLVG
jgi:hypothetical protein